MSPHPARYAPVRGVSSVPTFSLGSAVLVVGYVDRVAAVWSASFFDPRIFDRAVELVNLFPRFQIGAIVGAAPGKHSNCPST
jgi:hypothetical protein